MRSKIEIEAENRRDIAQWSHRMIMYFNDYHKAVSNEAKASAYRMIIDLVKEKQNLGYSFDYIDVFDVAGFKNEDRMMLAKLDKKLLDEQER